MWILFWILGALCSYLCWSRFLIYHDDYTVRTRAKLILWSIATSWACAAGLLFTLCILGIMHISDYIIDEVDWDKDVRW